ASVGRVLAVLADLPRPWRSSVAAGTLHAAAPGRRRSRGLPRPRGRIDRGAHSLRSLLQRAGPAGGAVIDRIRLPLRFDAAAMQADLRRLERHAWIEHFVRQNYEGDWSVLPLRAPASATHPVQMIYSDPACHEYVPTPLLAACPAIAAALDAFDCPLESVRLMRLGAGYIVKTHTDHELQVKHRRIRLHISIVTKPGVDFRLNREPRPLS